MRDKNLEMKHWTKSSYDKIKLKVLKENEIKISLQLELEIEDVSRACIIKRADHGLIGKWRWHQ